MLDEQKRCEMYGKCWPGKLMGRYVLADIDSCGHIIFYPYKDSDQWKVAGSCELEPHVA
jgi:hypothetical protein